MGVYKDKASGRLFIQFRFKGSYYKERLPVGVSRKEAERLEVQVKTQFLFERHGVDEPKANPTFERFIQDVYLPYVEINLADTALAPAIKLCKFFLKTLKGRKLRSIKAADVEAIKAARMALPTKNGARRSASTIVTEMSVLSKIFSLAIKNDAADYNPVARVKMPKINNIQNRILAESDETAFLAAFESDWSRDIAEFVLNTGMSQKDVLTMTKFQFDRETVAVYYVRSKTGVSVEVPLNATALAIIERRMKLPGSLLFPSPKTGEVGTSTQTAMENACKRAKIPKITIRDLRRTFGTRLHERSYDDMTVAQLLGHSDLRSVHRYKRGSAIKRTAVKSLEKPTSDAKIVPIGKAKNQK